MDFEVSDDQVALAGAVRALCAGRFPMSRVRALAGLGVDAEGWAALGDLGLFSLRRPEADGGAGLGWADTVLAFEELGRALVPGPLVWTHLAADLVPGADGGTVVVGGMDRADGSGLIEFPDVLDVLLVHDADGLWSLDRSDLGPGNLKALTPLDPLTPVARWSGDLPPGNRVLDPAATAQLHIQGAVLTSALLLGIAASATDLAVAYALDRRQFGRPIGSFQALKHLMADMLTRTEVARGAVYAAGVTLDDPAVGSVVRAAAAAKVTATEAALANAKTCVQVHGGMGYTWEVDAHLLLKRAYALAPAFGTVDHWADTMAGLLAAGLGSTA